MEEWILLLPLLGCGYVGYRVFRLLKFPLPALLGSLFATGALSLLGYFPHVSISGISFVAKVALGAMLGRRLDRSSLKLLRTLIVPACLICVWMLGFSFFSGWLLNRISSLPLSTTLIGSAPGGVSEMAVFAMSQGYDVATITFIQVFRLVFVLLVTPFIARQWSAKHPQTETTPSIPLANKTAAAPKANVPMLIFFACLGGWLGVQLKIPAGDMLGSMMGTALVGLSTGKEIPFPGWVRSWAQIGIGMSIAQRLGPESLTQLRPLLLPLIAPTFLIVISSLLLAVVLQRLTRWDMLTCLLSTSAGGLSQMIVIAEETEADSLTVGVLHTARFLSVISLMPILVDWWLKS